jgi:hypothetical protein
LRVAFDQSVSVILGPGMDPTDHQDDLTPEYDRTHDDDTTGTVAERDEIDQEAIDLYLNAEVTLPIDGELLTGKVVRRKRDADGNLIGKAAANPILDTRLYVVSFPDDREVEYAANVIAENMLSMCDRNGNQHPLMRYITDHRKDDTAVSKIDGYTWTRGRKISKKTTKRWKLCSA